MPLPQYTHGRVTGTYPDLTVVSERSESPMVCCGYCSAHMACITAKAGLSDLMKNEAHAIRAAGGRPHNYGSKDSERRAGALAALGITLKSVAIADIPARLRAGFAVEVALQYGDLPPHLKVQQNSFGHSACLFGWREADDMVGYFDPLWDQDARGAWTPWAGLVGAFWANGNHSTTVVRRVPSGGESVGLQFRFINRQDGVATVNADNKNLIRVDNAAYVSAPKGQKREVAALVELTAPLPSGVGMGSRHYLVGNVPGVKPDVSIAACLPTSDATFVASTTPVPPDSTPYSEADLLKAKQTQWDAMVGVFPPRPK